MWSIFRAVGVSRNKEPAIRRRPLWRSDGATATGFWQSSRVFFDDRAADGLLSKHSSKLASHRPEHFALATDSTRERQRAWVNQALLT